MNDRFELVIPTLFGLEKPVARELYRLGYDTKRVENGRVTIDGDYDAVVRTNIWLRCGERVLIKAGEFRAETADELYEGVKAIEWDRFISREGAFPVKGHTTRSKLASDRSSQIMIKKAIADSLGEAYGVSWMPETGATYQIQFTIIDDIVTVMIDTSGAPLHKRGYRVKSNLAPVRETIAAAMVMISYWKYEEPLIDPFCGSGTIPIEAAMFKRNIAPGIGREFAFSSFGQIDDAMVREIIEEAREEEHRDVMLDISASDIDPAAIELTRENSKRAGVGEFISVSRADARKIITEKSGGSIICNPPYGERLGDMDECRRLYRAIGKSFTALDKWSYYILTSHEDFEREFGKRADRRRKIYNGMLRCWLYQYYGNKPKKKG
ncbi:MAG: class I SAM-dependent RNA methyltransferase [Oscillospiraceae bacterium]|nr:class I SAM-dependent RNA methyltransferase [Oscillospiraceae bacterium]